MNFANALREYREGAGLTGDQLARRCDLHPSAVSRYESGERAPKYDTVEVMALELGLDRENRVILMLAAGYIPDNVRRSMDVVRALAPLIATLDVSAPGRGRSVAIQRGEAA